MERYSIDLAIDLLGRLNVLERLRSIAIGPRPLSYSFFPNPLWLYLSWLLERLVETGCIEVQKGKRGSFLPFAVFTLATAMRRATRDCS